jgi:hypothetical protein
MTGESDWAVSRHGTVTAADVEFEGESFSRWRPCTPTGAGPSGVFRVVIDLDV